MEQAETNPSKDAEFMNKMQSLIPDDKWDDYVTEWVEYEADYRAEVEIDYENDTWVVLNLDTEMHWFNFYELDYDARHVMESHAEWLSGHDYPCSYPVVLPKADQK